MGSKISGGPAASPRILNAPAVVLWTTGAIVAIYIGIALLPRHVALQVEYVLGLTPGKFTAGPEANGGVIGMIRPLFSSMLVHGSVPHIAMNSLWLLAFGAPVASRLGAAQDERGPGSISGAAIFLVFFALSGAFAALFFTAFHARDYTLLVGASGGISGLLGALVRFALRKPTYFTPGEQSLLPLFHPTVLAAAAVIILLNASILVFGGQIGGASIAWEAHIGGFLFGLVTFPVFDKWAKSVGAKH